MGMNVGSDSTTEDEGIVDINTTPLIDVMLVLLIMLIITIPLQTHSVSIDLPQGNPPPSSVQPDPVVDTVAIDFDNTITWNGEPVPDDAALQARFSEAAAQPVQPEMHIHPDRLASYKVVARVLADAQRLGVSKLGIMGSDQFMDAQ